MKITVLGSGTSQGVPIIGCSCKVCSSNDERDKRLRSSILIEIDGKTIVIDTGPDFRSQMLTHKVMQLDAIFFTHEHKDHTAGLDDIRPFNYMQRAEIPIFCSAQVEDALRREYQYIFAETKYPGAPEVTIHTIDNNIFQPFPNISATPIQVMHSKMPVFGFRINNFTYITDAKKIAAVEIEKVKGTEILIINALRLESHHSHFSLDDALAFITEIQPKKAYLTHISHVFGAHKEIEKMLPDGVFAAYDGLQINLATE
jgi:phosphoribosyl 1,2-cyclic phosphate phosphodiesterase